MGFLLKASWDDQRSKVGETWQAPGNSRNAMVGSIQEVQAEKLTKP